MIKRKITLRHYKEIVLDKIKTDTDNPQTYKVKKWINDDTINVKRLLKDMEREKLISISFVEDRGKVKRILKQINEIW
jgi:hypothetical protein